MMKLQIPEGNCLIEGEDYQARRFCKICKVRLIYTNDRAFICPVCGDRFGEESIKPVSRLVSVEDGGDVIAQPEPASPAASDLPEGAQLIREEEI